MKKSFNNSYKAIVVGASTGGINALETVLTMLPLDFIIPIIIVLHRAESPDNFLLMHFNSICHCSVLEAQEKSPIKKGNIYIAPGGYHLMVEMDHTFSLSVDPPVNWSRPSIDVLFETAAEAYREKLVGIIMTGANKDGSKGLAKIKKTGGLCIVQDPESATSSHMPLSALKKVAADYTLTLDGIGQILSQLDKNRGISA